MDLNELLVFVRVIQSGTFSAAARVLGMPKSTVSRRVSTLEERLGARLIQRTTRKLGLTDAGRIYFEHSARVVAEIEEAERAVSRVEGAPRGLLRATAPLSMAFLGGIVAEYLKRHPEVQVHLTCTDRQVDLVEEGFDVAIRAGHLPDSSLVARSLGSMRRVLVAAPGYLNKRGEPRTPEKLAEHACLVFGAGPTPNVWTLRSTEKKVSVRLSPRLTVNDFEMMLDAARAGIGIAWMPEFLAARDLRTGKLRQVLESWCSDATPVHAVYPTARQLSPKVVAFIAIVREKFEL